MSCCGSMNSNVFLLLLLHSRALWLVRDASQSRCQGLREEVVCGWRPPLCTAARAAELAGRPQPGAPYPLQPLPAAAPHAQAQGPDARPGYIDISSTAGCDVLHCSTAACGGHGAVEGPRGHAAAHAGALLGGGTPAACEAAAWPPWLPSSGCECWSRRSVRSVLDVIVVVVLLLLMMIVFFVSVALILVHDRFDVVVLYRRFYC